MVSGAFPAVGEIVMTAWEWTTATVSDRYSRKKGAMLSLFWRLISPTPQQSEKCPIGPKAYLSNSLLCRKQIPTMSHLSEKYTLSLQSLSWSTQVRSQDHFLKSCTCLGHVSCWTRNCIGLGFPSSTEQSFLPRPALSPFFAVANTRSAVAFDLFSMRALRQISTCN